jgi:hypothetical protein
MQIGVFVLTPDDPLRGTASSLAIPLSHGNLRYLCHVVREKVQVGLMRLLPVCSHNQTADIFTKASHPRHFHDFVLKLGMVDIYHPPACRGVLNHSAENSDLTTN